MRIQNEARSAPTTASPLTLSTPEQTAAAASSTARTLGFIFGSIFLTVVLAVVWLQFGPTFVTGPSVLPLIAAFVLAVAGVFVLSRLAWGMYFRYVKWTVGILVPLLVVFCWGASVTVYIDGEAQLATSNEAHAYVMLGDLYDDLAEINSYTELINAEQLVGRSRLREFGPAETALLDIRNRWDLSIAELGELPDPNFVGIVSAVETAAYYQAQAVLSRSLILSSFDPQVREDMFSYQETVQLKINEAGFGIAAIGPTYSFNLSEWKNN